MLKNCVTVNFCDRGRYLVIHAGGKFICDIDGRRAANRHHRRAYLVKMLDKFTFSRKDETLFERAMRLSYGIKKQGGDQMMGW